MNYEPRSLNCTPQRKETCHGKCILASTISMKHRQASEPEAVNPRATQYLWALLLNPCMVFPTRPCVETWPRVTSYIDAGCPTTYSWQIQKYTNSSFNDKVSWCRLLDGIC